MKSSDHFLSCSILVIFHVVHLPKYLRALCLKWGLHPWISLQYKDNNNITIFLYLIYSLWGIFWIWFWSLLKPSADVREVHINATWRNLKSLLCISVWSPPLPSNSQEVTGTNKHINWWDWIKLTHSLTLLLEGSRISNSSSFFVCKWSFS